ncbi:MAG TPA: caspase family protein [Chitinophagales bacterium]|nr:caspase family protein [Chitinophagales bacterium]
MNDKFNQGFAVIVGVGNPDIAGTINDAKGLAEILKDPQRCAYPEENISLLLDKESVCKNVVGALQSLQNKTSSDSTVIFYFSGHGYEEQLGSQTNYYLITWDANPSDISNTALNGNELSQLLKGIPCRRMLILLDCCHSGGLDDAKAFTITSSKSPMPIEAQNLLQAGTGRVIIASSMANELSFAGNPYSAFTLALIECLAGQGVSKRDGLVRVADIALYAREKVPARTKNRQHPILNYEQADNFPIAYYAAGEITPKELPFKGEPQIEEEPGEYYRMSITNSGNLVTGDVTGTNIQGGNIQTGNVSGTGITIGTGAHTEVTIITYPASDEIKKLFVPLFEAAAKSENNKAEATQVLKDLSNEIAKKEKSNDSHIGKLIDKFVDMVPGAVSTVVSTFASPLLGKLTGPVTQFVLDKLRGK